MKKGLVGAALLVATLLVAMFGVAFIVSASSATATPPASCTAVSEPDLQTLIADAPDPAGEGGVGFDLPKPGTPRQLAAQPATPDPRRRSRALRRGGGPVQDSVDAARRRSAWKRPGTAATTATSSAGAQGLMQFMPATWAAMGVDGDGDGRADIRNDADSVLSRRQLPHQVRGHQGRRRRRPARAVRLQPRRLVRQRRPLLRPPLRRRHRPRRPADCGAGGQGEPEPATADQRPDRHRPRLGAAARRRAVRRTGANGPTPATAPASPGPPTPRSASACPAPPPRSGPGSPPATASASTRPGTPGDLVFWDSYLRPQPVGHVMIVFDPATSTTIEAGRHRTSATSPNRHRQTSPLLDLAGRRTSPTARAAPPTGGSG